MTNQTVKITPMGTRNEASEGHEVLLVGGVDSHSEAFEARSELAVDGWELINDVNGGPAHGPLTYTFRGLHGTLELELGARGKLAFITHPWSGIVKIELGEFASEFDLYSSETKVICIDLPSGQLDQPQGNALKALTLRTPKSAQPKISHVANKKAHENELVITALGKRSSGARDSEVIILHVEPFGLGVQADLTVYKGPNWKQAGEIVVDNKNWKNGLKGRKGVLRMDCSASGTVTFLRHEWSGFVEISYGKTAVTIDLYSHRPSLLTLRVDELDLLVLEETDDAAEGKDAKGFSVIGEDTPRRVLFQRMAQAFDTSKPVALYVPRWHGVAASTRALFDQTLPVPDGRFDHPDNVTEEDIQEYADILVETNCRHFVVSGGDLFNLAIIDAVLERAPTTRFDQLWHSNFLQMGEPHDWNLLRHWLGALHDGKVTRIGVVKEGLADWFKQFDIDAVFIPNVIEFDPATVRPTTINDTVGIWLSGSSSYRKLPHAALMALKMVPNVALMGAGFDAASLRMINDLKLPFRQISADPVPQQQMFKMMAKTGLNLYVTLSECSPMVPLESFALGVPCLVGPSSHLFRRCPILSEALVVQHPTSPGEIAEKIQAAMQDQERLFKAYLAYYGDEKQMAADGMARLIA